MTSDADAPLGRRLRVAIVADMLEERWPSMDLVADSLLRELPRQAARPIQPLMVRPRLVPLISRFTGRNGNLPTADRVFNRFWIYPRRLAGAIDGCSVFHIIDHSYAHLTLSLPPGKVITTCHDIDTFRGFYGPGRIETALPRFLVDRLVAGLRASALVVCPSRCTADALVETGLVSRDRLRVVANGVEAPIEDAGADREAERLLAAPGRTVDILHVGSAIDRKRIDLLLEAVARVTDRVPEVRLVRVGGPFTTAQQGLASRLGLSRRVLVLPFLDRGVLNAIYRRSTLLLVTSDREGFGLPIVEALSAGLPVVARDLPVFREVAGDAATFIGTTDPVTWADTIVSLLDEARRDVHARESRCAAGRAWVSRYSWARYAGEMAALYAEISSQGGS
jgi:glycosyltransferase involved in cell wall biosynthesis